MVVDVVVGRVAVPLAGCCSAQSVSDGRLYDWNGRIVRDVGFGWGTRLWRMGYCLDYGLAFPHQLVLAVLCFWNCHHRTMLIC